jgi:AcrR family transcriptional regulator
MSPVKAPRAYNSRRRREQARQRQETVLGVARRLFLENGYAATTLAGIAAAADVSVETIYKAFGNKAGLLRAVAEAALAGPGPMSTMQRSDEMRARETNPNAIIRKWAEFASEVTPRAAPVILLIRSAAGGSAELTALLDQLDADRLDRMAHHARFLRDRGYLRQDVTETQARDVMWAYTDPALYELLVLRQHWPLERFRGFLADALTAALLPPANG